MSDELAYALADVEEFIGKYVVFESNLHATAVMLWAASTWLNEDDFDAWSYLAITSPEKESGKTRLLEVLELLVRRPWRTTLPSPAALYSKLEQDRPTLLLDEVDAVFSQRSDSAEALRGVLNAGNRRGGTVSRVVMQGQARSVAEFNVYGPKALAGIRSLPETLASRSIVIPMRRRKPGEAVEPFRSRIAAMQAAELTERLKAALANTSPAAWAESIGREGIDGLTDRQAEGWQPMIALAGLAGTLWFAAAHEAALSISAAQREADDTSVGAKLLEHIRDAFGEADRIKTRDLLTYLRARVDGPWATMFDETWDLHDQKSASRLAAMLKPYDIRPRRPRFGEEQAAGYLKADFADAWQRWTTSTPESSLSTPPDHS